MDDLTPYRYASAGPPWAYPYLGNAVEALCPQLGHGSRVLDVGCGSGFWSNLFAQKGCVVVGIDPSESGIAVAKGAYPGPRFVRTAASEDLCQQLGLKQANSPRPMGYE